METMPAHDQAVTLGQALAHEIERRGLTQKEAAEELGVAQQAVTRWVRSQTRPRDEYTDAIARFLRVSPKRVREMRSAARPRAALEARVDRLEVELRELRDAITTLLARQTR